MIVKSLLPRPASVCTKQTNKETDQGILTVVYILGIVYDVSSFLQTLERLLHSDE